MISDSHEAPGLSFDPLHVANFVDRRRRGFFHEHVHALLQRGDGHGLVEVNSSGDEADVCLRSEGMKHLAVVGEQTAAELTETSTFLRFFFLVDHRRSDELCRASFVESQQVLVVDLGPARDTYEAGSHPETGGLTADPRDAPSRRGARG